MLEAAVLKKFIISTNCPTGPKEILNNGKGGDLVKIGDYKSISRKLTFYSKNRNYKRSKITNVYNSLYRFDLEKNQKKYLNIILKYLEK